MFGKLLLIVVTLIGTGAVLLVLRHERIERMHEITRLHEAIDAEAARLRGLRSQVAAEITPDRVRELMRRVELAWVPVPAVPGAAAARTPELDAADGDPSAPVSIMALLEAGFTPADAIAALHPAFQNAAADVERLAARTPAPLPVTPFRALDAGAASASAPAADGAVEAAQAAAAAAAVEAEAAIRTDHRPAAWIGVWPPRTEPTVLPRSRPSSDVDPAATVPDTSSPADAPRSTDPERS